MGGDREWVDRVEQAPAPAWDRFAHWPRQQAQVALLAFVLLFVAAMLAPISAGRSTVATAGFTDMVAGKNDGPKRKRDDDLALYDEAIERIQRGENYYDFIVPVQRAANYPVNPGLAVRLPTLAYLDAWLGKAGQMAAALALMLAVLAVWWRRLGEEPCSPRTRRMAIALLFVGASLGLNRYYFVLHELWAGMLIALAFGLHRPDRGKWGAAFVVAALALAIREHVLPFVLLLGAYAAWRREWREAAAWGALTLTFLAALSVHLDIVAQQVLPTDRPSDPWLVMRGLGGWLSNVVLSSNLRFLPDWIAGPAVILMMLGWCGWRSAAGVFGTFLYLGYGLAFMIAGRPDNFYWGAVIAPAMFIGIAFAPQALFSLVTAATERRGARAKLAQAK